MYSHRTRSSLAALLVVAAVGLAVACTSDGGGSASPGTTEFTLPPPSFGDVPRVTIPEGFVQPDTRSASLGRPVRGKAVSTPAIPVYGGHGALRGSVVGPDGPVPGAVVKLERFVGDESGSVLINAGGDGGFSATGLRGGRYRVRAWLQPSLTATEAQTAFLADEGGVVDVTVEVRKFDALSLQANFDVSFVTVGGTAHVRALLTRATVGDDGIVDGQPVPATELKLGGDGGYAVDGSGSATTDGGGVASWQVTCTRGGNHSMNVTGGGATAGVRVATCGLPTPSTTTPAIPDFPIGRTFTVPYGGPLPAGTYRAASGTCATTYEQFVDGQWSASPTESRGAQLQLANPGRNFRAAPGSDACTYERLS